MIHRQSRLGYQLLQPRLCSPAVPAVLLCLLLLLSPQAVQAEDGSYKPLPLHILEQRARNGTASAQYLLGRRSLLGQQAPQSASKGLKWLRRSAESGHPPALLFLAQAYEHGKNVPRDFVQAFSWYRKAADKGVEAALMKLRPLQSADPAKELLLFEVPLRRTNPFCIRYALESRGAALLETADPPGCDRFAASSLLKGADQVRICYAPDGGLAHLEYRFPPRTAEEEDPLPEHYRRLVAKYGEPQQTERQDGAPWKYVWRHRKVRIIFWHRPDRDTSFLRYLVPENQERLMERLQEQNASRMRQSDLL